MALGLWNWVKYLVVTTFFAMLGDIDLIFGIWVYNNELQIILHFVPVQWFLDLGLWNLAKYFVVTTLFRYAWKYWLDFWYSDELQIKFTFCSGSMIFGSWTLKFGQIFSCHHFFSICLKILTWFLVYEYMYIIMRYRSNLHFVPVQWFLALGLWPNI